MKIINFNLKEKKIELLINSRENKDENSDLKITELVKEEYNININIISDEDCVFNGYYDAVGNKLYNYVVYYENY
jgi:hypothetical protein